MPHAVNPSSAVKSVLSIQPATPPSNSGPRLAAPLNWCRAPPGPQAPPVGACQQAGQTINRPSGMFGSSVAYRASQMVDPAQAAQRWWLSAGRSRRAPDRLNRPCCRAGRADEKRDGAALDRVAATSW